MANKTRGATVVLAAGSLAVSLVSFFYIRRTDCRNRYRRCIGDCERRLEEELSGNLIKQNMIRLEYYQRRRDCRINNLGDEEAIRQCQSEVDAWQAEELARIEALDNAARARRLQCEAECRKQASHCDKELSFLGEIPPPSVSIEVDCIEDGSAPCYKKVSELCTKIAGPCDDCWRTLCGDGTWSFESDIQLEINLVAATDPKKDARVLSTSSRKGKQVVLPIPKNIKLNDTEQLYIGFSSNIKPAGPVRVLIHRSK
jgi:hypothetical protein